MKSSSNQLKLPINVVKPMLSHQKPLSLSIKSEKEDIEDDIVFLEEKPSSTLKLNAKNYEASNFNTVQNETANSAIISNNSSKAHSEDNCEFIFSYSQDTEDIGFDSDDELTSSFEMCEESVRNKKTSNLEGTNSSFDSSIESDTESDDDIKFIMQNNTMFFSKIDAILIDLTKDDESPNYTNDQAKTSKQADRSRSPILIKTAEKEVKLTQSKLSFQTEKSSEKALHTHKSSSEITLLNLDEVSSLNDEIICKTVNTIKTQDTSTNKTKYFNHTHQIDTEKVPRSLNSNESKQFHEQVIEPITNNDNTSKKLISNLKYSKEIASSDVEAGSHDKRLNNLSESKIKLIKYNHDADKTKTAVISKANSDFSNLNVSPKPLADLTSQFDKICSPKSSLLASKTKTLPEKSVVSKPVGLSNKQTVTGENVQNKRVIQIIEPPSTSKRPKFSIDSLTPNNIHLADFSHSETRTNEKQVTEREKLMTEENETPILNSVDLKKKLALENLSLSKKASDSVSTVSFYKAREELGKKKFKEKDLVLKRLHKKQMINTGVEFSLTQQVDLGKLENKARIQKINELKQQKLLEQKRQQMYDLSVIVPTKPAPSKSIIIPIKSNPINQQQQKYLRTVPETTSFCPPAMPSRLNSPKVDLNNNNNIQNQRQIYKQSIYVDSFKSNGSLSTKSKSIADTNWSSNRTDETLPKNDVVTPIITSINKQQQQQNSDKKTNAKIRPKQDYIYSIDNFIDRIVSWRFVWLMEQEKFKQEKKTKSTYVPIVKDDELMPIVERYVNYDEYQKTMVPFLLLEIWEDISRAYRENMHSQKPKTYNNTPIWLKQVGRGNSSNSFSYLVCQTFIEENSRINFEEDALKLSLPIIDPINKQKSIQSDCFAIVKKSVKLKENDKCILDVVKDYAKNIKTTEQKTAQTYSESSSQLSKNKENDKKMNTLIFFELHVQIKARRYTWKPNMTLDYEILNNLASSFRKIKALLEFKNSEILKSILSPSVTDPVYMITKNRNQNESLIFDQITEYNESQRQLITEASMIVTSHDPKLYFIQGPPGTGKTSTIIGIVKAINTLANTPQHNHLRKKKPKILICSPSNCGCNEIVKRLRCDKELSVVRVGVSNSLQVDSDEMNFNNLVKKKFQDLLNKEQCKKSSSLREQYETFTSRESLFKKRLKELYAAAVADHNAIKNNEIWLEEIIKNKKNFEEVLKKINAKNDLSSSDKKRLDQIAKELVLKEAEVIVSTLNFSGNRILDCLTKEKNKGIPFFDSNRQRFKKKAAQCLEVDFLIPMRFSCSKIIQIGDPEQLPATILSTRAQDLKFQKSFFERIYHNFFFEEKNPIKMLHIQYRMHPEICAFPSLNFYRGKLTSHAETINNRKQTRLEPYLIFDIPDSQDVQDKGDYDSIYNKIEAKELVQFYKILRRKYRELSVGIITPYQKQAKIIHKLIAERNLEKADVGTVDSFQGREQDIILLSTVRANQTNSIGFVSNKQRLNVSLTRAKYALYIFCNQNTLKSNDDWNNCFKDAQKRKLIRTIRVDNNKNSS